MSTLFQVMALEGWADIARGLQESHPGAGIYVLAFILCGTFVVLNLCIAVIGNAMQDLRDPRRPATMRCCASCCRTSRRWRRVDASAVATDARTAAARVEAMPARPGSRVAPGS